MTTLSLIINVLGGLAIFIYGMTLMSDGLNQVAGERMRSILRMFSANRFVGILSGTAVTAVIQSSSASTVMVIGFVNAGLLTLVQAIGIIFGANIGTTVTAQLVAFDIAWIIMPSIILGLGLNFFPSRTMKGWGITVLGLGFLFFGMGLMSNELKVLGQEDWFRNMFQVFECAPVDGWIPPFRLLGALFVGLLATFIIQSSSACTGIVLALGASGLIDLYTGVALILGSNIGTTVTAQLAALTANRVAKQAALAHTLFNCIGVLLMISTFWIILPGTKDPVFFHLVKVLSGDGADALPRQMANAHTIFNVCTTLVLVAFIPLLARICEKLIPVRQEKQKFVKLEPHLLDTPEIALSQTGYSIRKMLKKSWKMVDCALKIYNRNDERNQEKVKGLDKNEEKVDMYQRDITSYLSHLMCKPITEIQADRIPKLIHCTNDAERIGDHTFAIKDMITRFLEGENRLSEAAEAEYASLHKLLSKQADCVTALLEAPSVTLQKQAFDIENEIKKACDSCESNHLKRMSEKTCTLETGLFYMEILSELRIVSRHFANIAERAASFTEHRKLA